MRKTAVAGPAVVCVCLLFVLSGVSAQRITPGERNRNASSRVPVVVEISPAMQEVAGTVGVGNPQAATPASTAAGTAGFIGVTAETFDPGVGVLVASRACHTAYPRTRLCEWADVFRSIPPPALGTEVLIAPNYEVDPETTCITPDGGLRCKHGAAIPAACCGTAPMNSVATILLSPSLLTLDTCSNQFVLTATAVGPTGTPVPGVLTFFEFSTTGSGSLTGSFNPISGVTDVNGEVSTTLAIDAIACAVNCIDRNCTAAVRARDPEGRILSNAVPLIDQIP